MPARSYEYIVKKIQKKTFGILSTVSPKGFAQSTGVLYGTQFRSKKIIFYIVTSKKYIKSQNIENNKHVSFLIPFPHHWFRFVPSSTIYFQGIAKFLPIDDANAIASHKERKVLEMSLDQLKNEKSKEELTFLEITPSKTIHIYGVGFSILESRKNPHGLYYNHSVLD